MSGAGPDLGADTIVVAAGRSSRMGGADKLAFEIDGRPLLAWTLDALAAAPAVGRIVVVTSAERRAEVAARRVAAGQPSSTWSPAAAGARNRSMPGSRSSIATRADDGGVVLVHDAARPLVEPDLVAAVAEATARHGAAIPIVPVAETLKRIDGDLVGATVERSGLGAAQTPQGVRRDLLREAYRRFPADGPDTFTDEAALLEACSIPVHVVPGDPGNLKVTLPADLRRVATVLGDVPTPSGRGSATTAIRSGRAGRSAWAGWRSTGAPRLVGHSDGDVVLHAVCDALLGAAGLGDLGRLFPADARTPRGIDSAVLIDEVRRRVEAAGWRPASRRPDDHRRPAAARRPARPDARPDRRPPRAGPGRRSTSRPRPATSTAPRAPAGRSRRW